MSSSLEDPVVAMPKLEFPLLSYTSLSPVSKLWSSSKVITSFVALRSPPESVLMPLKESSLNLSSVTALPLAPFPFPP